jgi:hypothetical protein
MSFKKLLRNHYARRAIRKERKRAYKIICDKDQGHFGPGFSAFLAATKFKQNLNEQETTGQKAIRYTKTALLVIFGIFALWFIFVSLRGLAIYQ